MRIASEGSLESWQREFFLAYAQLRCKFEDRPRSEVEDLRRSYAPPRVVIDTVLSNMPQFAGAFHCESGKPMAPQKRCVLW